LSHAAANDTTSTSHTGQPMLGPVPRSCRNRCAPTLVSDVHPQAPIMTDHDDSVGVLDRDDDMAEQTLCRESVTRKRSVCSPGSGHSSFVDPRIGSPSVEVIFGRRRRRAACVTGHPLPAPAPHAFAHNRDGRSLEQPLHDVKSHRRRSPARPAVRRAARGSWLNRTPARPAVHPPSGGSRRARSSAWPPTAPAQREVETNPAEVPSQQLSSCCRG
jgi:hypothetical protein